MKKIKIKKMRIENNNGIGYFLNEKFEKIIDYYKLETLRAEVAKVQMCQLNRVVFDYEFLN